MNIQQISPDVIPDVNPSPVQRKEILKDFSYYMGQDGIYRILSLVIGCIGLPLSIIYNSNIGIGVATPLISYGFFGIKSSVGILQETSFNRYS